VENLKKLLAKILSYIAYKLSSAAIKLTKSTIDRLNNQSVENGKNYQLNYHNETIATKKYELSENRDKLKAFIAKYANTYKDVLFKENIEILDELNKLYKVSNLIDFTKCTNYVYSVNPVLVKFHYLYLLTTHLFYNEEKDELKMCFCFGIDGLDGPTDGAFNFNNTIMLEGPVVDEFCKKTEYLKVTIKFPKDPPKGPIGPKEKV